MEHSVSYTKCHDDVLTVRLEHEFLAHPTQDPTDALAHLEQVSKNVADLASRTAQVRRYQMALHQELLDASDLILLMCALSSLEQLWRAAESWRSQTTIWMEVRESFSLFFSTPPPNFSEISHKSPPAPPRAMSG